MRRPIRSATLGAALASGALLAFVPSSYATPWQADPQAISVSDRIVADCEDAATDKGLSSFEWEKDVAQCIKDSRG